MHAVYGIYRASTIKVGRSTLIVLAASQRGCTINAIDRIHSKLPTEDEQLTNSKHVEDITGINLKRTCIWFVLVTQIGLSHTGHLLVSGRCRI